MEEYKEQQAADEIKNTSPLSFGPGQRRVSKGKSSGDTSKEKGGAPRVSNALASNLAATPQTLAKNFGIDLSSAEFTEESKVVDQRGNLKKLDRKQKQIVKALLFTFFETYSDDEAVNSYIENIDSQELIARPIKLEELCGLIYGDKERYKKDKQDIIKKRVYSLANTYQLQVYKTQQKNLFGEDVVVKVKSPYIAINREIEIEAGKRKVVGLNITFHRIFFQDVKGRSCPIKRSFFSLTDSSGKKIDSDLFQSLTNLIESLYYYHVYGAYKKAQRETQAQYGRSLPVEQYKKILRDNEQKALTRVLSFSRIKEMTITNYNDNPKMKRAFYKDLYEAVRALITYGIITEKSYINEKAGIVGVVYNPFFGVERKGGLSIAGSKFWKLDQVKEEQRAERREPKEEDVMDLWKLAGVSPDDTGEK